MTLDAITITYPTTKRVGDKRIAVTSKVRWTGKVKKFSEISDGELFLIDSNVYEKLGTKGTAAQLQPWDNDAFYEFKSNKIVGTLLIIKPEKF